MSIEETLRKVEADSASGDLGRARDRLHGLISTYADDLSLRARLGAVYWRLGYPAMAGLYWYLEEERSPDMEVACRAFERRHGNSAVGMLAALKYRGDVEALRATCAGRTLLDLQQRAREERADQARSTPEAAAADRERSPDFRAGVVGLSCLFVLLVLVAIVVVGIIALH